MKTTLTQNSFLFWFFHVASLGVFFFPFHWSYLILAVSLYFVRMFFVTAGYHRYFSHRAYSTSRVFQFILAFMAMTSSQKGVLWWASHHRDHHQHSDQEEDIHSPKKGFYWSHVGWILSDQYGDTDFSRIKDFAKFPELVWLNEHWMAPLWVYALTLLAFGGLPYVFWGLIVSTVMLWHGTFTINSLSHLWGKRRYATTDTSRNNGILSILTLGEGWHNNHHQYPGAARNGFFWYEHDVTFYTLKILSWFGIVWNLRPVPTSAMKPQ